MTPEERPGTWREMLHESPYAFPSPVQKAVGIAAFAGAILFVVFFDYHDTFTKVWLGLAFGLFFGAFGSVAWSLIRYSRPPAPWSRLRLPLIGAALFGAFAIWGLTRATGEMKRISDLRSLDAAAIGEIRISTEMGDRLLETIDDPEAIDRFVRACREVEGYTPNHPHYTDTWLVQVIGPTPVELHCNFERRHPDAVVVSFVTVRGNTVWYHGDAISRDLRPWFEEYVVQSEAEGGV